MRAAPLARGLLALATAAVLGLSACGQSEEDRVEEVVEAYFDDLSARDYDGACSVAGAEFRQTLDTYAEETYPKLPSRDCEAVLRKIGSVAHAGLVRSQRQLEAREVRLDGRSAEVDLAPGQSAELAKRGGEWKITRLDFGEAG